MKLWLNIFIADNYSPHISMETKFRRTENSKTNETCKFLPNLPQRFDFRRSNKYVSLQNLSIYYMWKYIRQKHKNNKLKIIAPT